MNWLINCSGHTLSDTAIELLRARGYQHIEMVKPLQIEFSEDVHIQIRDVVNTIETPLDGSVAVTIILPGHSVVAVLLLIFLHGVLGHFPTICLMQQSDSGEVFLPASVFAIDSREVRMAGRMFRQESWARSDDSR